MNTNIDQELIMAAGGNNVPVVRRLLRAGAGIDSYSGAPLRAASSHGSVQVVKELLEHGADTEAKGFCGARSLHSACCKGHLAVVNELLSPANDSNGAATSIRGKRKNRREAYIDAKDDEGDTPLHCASQFDHLPVVKALLSSGAHLLAVNDRGQLPIHYAMHARSSEVSKYLLKQLYATIRRLPLHKLLKDLTWIGIPRIRVGVPPLRAALHHNVLGTDDVVEIVEYLVERNPELLSSRDRDGAFPLHVACRRGASFAIVQSLVNHCKASVKSVTPQGDLPLFLACEMPEPSLDTIFTLVKLYPDLVFR
jgi:ankyrin repeat protein